MWEATIGLEIHLQLNTRTKMFCGCQADTFGAEPNRHICPVCLGLPGSLPVPNRQAVEFAIRLALALHCEVAHELRFDRKNYFYPDMPKNYQISQYQLPLGRGGSLDVGGRVRIRRLHLEEDAGKSIHPPGSPYALIDLNRAGVPLIELVTEPDLTSPEQARLFLQHIQAIAQSLEISEASPEEGKLRADVNVSLHRPGEPLGTKVEIKNLNSFRSVQRALEYEIRRQTELLRQGRKIEQATLGFDEGSGKTYPMRLKEEEADYRYFPEPDLPPVVLGADWIQEIRAALPELPAERAARYQALGVRPYDAELIAYHFELARFFDEALNAQEASPQAVANWLGSDVLGYLNQRELSLKESRLLPHHLAELAGLQERGEITSRVAKELLPEVMGGASPKELVRTRGLSTVVDPEALRALVAEVLQNNPSIVEQIRGGKHQALNALLGQVMRLSQGRAQPERVRELLETALGLRA